MRTATRRLRRLLGLFCYLSEHALEIGAWLLCADLAGHVDEALRLRRIVGRWFRFAWHRGSIYRSRLFVEQRQFKLARIATRRARSTAALARLRMAARPRFGYEASHR